MKTDREEPEMPKPQFTVEQSTERFRVPIVETGEDRVEEPANQHIMKVRDNEVRIRKLPVERRNCQHDSRQTGNQKLKQEAETEDHRYFQPNFPAVHRAQP